MTSTRTARALTSLMALGYFLALGGLSVGGLLIAIALRHHLPVFSLTSATGMLLAGMGLIGVRVAFLAVRLRREMGAAIERTEAPVA